MSVSVGINFIFCLSACLSSRTVPIPSRIIGTVLFIIRFARMHSLFSKVAHGLSRGFIRGLFPFLSFYLYFYINCIISFGFISYFQYNDLRVCYFTLKFMLFVGRINIFISLLRECIWRKK